MTNPYADKTALVTGANSGLGFEAAAQLAEAGFNGITTIERPAPRWSGYVHELRSLGIPIETEMVAHGGAYSGHHARYRLACDATLTVLQERGAA